MTAGKPFQPPPYSTARPSEPPNFTSSTWFNNASGERVNTDVLLVQTLRKDYPNLHLAVVPSYSTDLLAYASAGYASLAPIDSEKERLSWKIFAPSATRLNGGRGALLDDVKFGKYLLDWQGKEFVVVIADCRDGNAFSAHFLNQYVLSPSVQATNSLLFEAGVWSKELHDEIWVFDSGFWQKSRELYESVQKARWEDVILEEGRKKEIIDDTVNFFDNRDTYERLKVPWKRGIIYYGPPGNGKTISIKAMMHTLAQRSQAVPTLYVKSLASFAGPEASINSIFALARRTAPCYLVFEDLDSIVTDRVRSYFLNAVDGIQKNDGILMVGSTNHLDRLDPGIAKRPSRFDRKYLFPNPTETEREQYMHYWQGKLSDNDDVDFPDKLCPAIAKITKGFSFAYLQEAMIAALLVIARDGEKFVESVCLECLETHGKQGRMCEREGKRVFRGLGDWIWEIRRLDDEDKDLERYVLWREVKRQVRILREELEGEKGR